VRCSLNALAIDLAATDEASHLDWRRNCRRQTSSLRRRSMSSTGGCARPIQSPCRPWSAVLVSALDRCAVPERPSPGRLAGRRPRGVRRREPRQGRQGRQRVRRRLLRQVVQGGRQDHRVRPSAVYNQPDGSVQLAGRTSTNVGSVAAASPAYHVARRPGCGKEWRPSPSYARSNVTRR
jgi:hypothetical protein